LNPEFLLRTPWLLPACQRADDVPGLKVEKIEKTAISNQARVEPALLG